jgi:NAD(P)-dependent dehydrogenase (short-subunit alcohol dehydrogenase family)
VRQEEAVQKLSGAGEQTVDGEATVFKDKVLKDRVALITGGGTGLGLAMAERFGELGARLCIVSRGESHLTEAAAKLEARGFEVLTAAADVREYDQVEGAVGQAVQKFGRLDILVNNAAGNFLSPTENLSPRAFAAVVGIVLNGSFNATLAAGKQMIEQGGGRILNIVTNYAWTGSAYVVPSACGKAGVLAMTRSLAVEWAKHGIRVNAVAPGPFPTKGAWAALLPTPELEEQAKAQIPLKRWGKIEELTNLVAYLVSDYADYINGDCITIDGGQWLYGAGMFNRLTEMPDEAWQAYAAAAKTARGK